MAYNGHGHLINKVGHGWNDTNKSAT